MAHKRVPPVTAVCATGVWAGHGTYLHAVTRGANQAGNWLDCRWSPRTVGGRRRRHAGPRAGDLIHILGVQAWPDASAQHGMLVQEVRWVAGGFTLLVDPPILPAGRHRTVVALPANNAAIFRKAQV